MHTWDHSESNYYFKKSVDPSANMWVYHTRSCSDAQYICLKQHHKREDIVCVLIYFAVGCYLTAFLCFRAVCMSAVTNTRFSHCALSYRLSSFAKWTVPVADILQIQSNWLHKSHSESLNLTSSHSRSLRTELKERLVMDFSSFWRRFRKISKNLLLTSSCLYICPHGTTRLPLDGFSWNLIFWGRILQI